MDNKPHNLTRREQQVIALAAQDKPDKITASLLGCSQRTITTHWQNIFQKTGTHSRAAVVALFFAACLNTDAEQLLDDITNRA